MQHYLNQITFRYWWLLALSVCVVGGILVFMFGYKQIEYRYAVRAWAQPGVPEFPETGRVRFQLVERPSYYLEVSSDEILKHFELRPEAKSPGGADAEIRVLVKYFFDTPREIELIGVDELTDWKSLEVSVAIYGDEQPAPW